MHEIGIAQNILDVVETQARSRPEAAFRAVGIRIGEFSSVNRDALDFAFSVLTRDTAFANVKLEVEWCPRRECCADCGTVFAGGNELSPCLNCGGRNTSLTGGDELDIAYLEVEEPCESR